MGALDEIRIDAAVARQDRGDTPAAGADKAAEHTPLMKHKVDVFFIRMFYATRSIG